MKFSPTVAQHAEVTWNVVASTSLSPTGTCTKITIGVQRTCFKLSSSFSHNPAHKLPSCLNHQLACSNSFLSIVNSIIPSCIRLQVGNYKKCVLFTFSLDFYCDKNVLVLWSGSSPTILEGGAEKSSADKDQTTFSQNILANWGHTAMISAI